jgi:hypothetical protein
MSSLALSLAAQAESDIKRYLKTVYPTSQIIANMTNATAERYYEQLHFWYRVPTSQHPDGLFGKNPTIRTNTFLQSHHVTIDGAAGETVGQEGFPNAHYLEVASYGFLPFHAGAYYYWSPGSGIFLKTDGSTLVAYNKIHMLYKLLNEPQKHFIKKLENIPMVQLQVWGKSQPLNQTMLKEICASHDTYFWVDEYPDKSQGPSLLGCLRSILQWPVIHAQLCRSTVEQAKEFLLTIYLQDHIEGKYEHTASRYAYIIGEANEEIDPWLYDLARSKNISVLQLTRVPNNHPNLAFEIMDARWPALNPQTTSLHQLTDQWNNTIAHHRLQLRDPFNLNNDRFAQDITLSFPDLNRFETFDDWFKTSCLKFAVDNSGNNGFSMTNTEHNTQLLYPTAGKSLERSTFNIA